MTMAHLYLIFLGIGALGLLSSLIFGDFDHGDIEADVSGDLHLDTDTGVDVHGDTTGSPKLLSVRAIFAFLLAFGIGGGALYLSGQGILLQLFIGATAGILIAVGVYYFMKFLYSFQGASNVDSKSFVNQNAIVTIGTTKTGLCQIEVDTHGGDRLFMAKEANGKKLRKNTNVKVIRRSGNILIVEKHK
jgi:membrane protein implicated in regulation of membrane protease activity